MRIGFSPRKGKLSLYITMDASKYSLYLDKIVKYKTDKSCIYINKLSDVDVDMLEKLIIKAYNDAPNPLEA